MKRKNIIAWLFVFLLLLVTLLVLKLTKLVEPKTASTKEQLFVSTNHIDVEKLAKDLTADSIERKMVTEAFYDIERGFHGNWINLFSENHYVTVVYNSAWQESYPITSVTVIFSVLEPKRKIENETDWLHWPKNRITFSVFFRNNLEKRYDLHYTSRPADYPDYNSSSGNPVGLAGVWSKTINIRDRNYWKK